MATPGGVPPRLPEARSRRGRPPRGQTSAPPPCSHRPSPTEAERVQVVEPQDAGDGRVESRQEQQLHRLHQEGRAGRLKTACGVAGGPPVEQGDHLPQLGEGPFKSGVQLLRDAPRGGGRIRRQAQRGQGLPPAPHLIRDGHVAEGVEAPAGLGGDQHLGDAVGADLRRRPPGPRGAARSTTVDPSRAVRRTVPEVWASSREKDCRGPSGVMVIRVGASTLRASAPRGPYEGSYARGRSASRVSPRVLKPKGVWPGGGEHAETDRRPEDVRRGGRARSRKVETPSRLPSSSADESRASIWPAVASPRPVMVRRLPCSTTPVVWAVAGWGASHLPPGFRHEFLHSDRLGSFCAEPGGGCSCICAGTVGRRCRPRSTRVRRDWWSCGQPEEHADARVPPLGGREGAGRRGPHRSGSLPVGFPARPAARGAGARPRPEASRRRGRRGRRAQPPAERKRLIPGTT